ncbi:methyl-CpG-binding domain protein 2-like [Tropilaelaps mercedesae]|uniref:Methyl-CpG-binding domain protein 2-like n=1 Tax=Tropilaelaps mercedesae TaxID=418985 RepID=A0A1V9Y0Z1_9ACAR|nr:methyl-CpG-binding domain protein 2-like [Tropilaelaps mercedesae]
MSDLYLPKGWRREEQARRLGLSAGKVDVFYYGPDGQRYRSKQQLVRALGDSVDLTAFDFRSGKLSAVAARKARQQSRAAAGGNGGGPSYEYLRGLKAEACLVAPIRQTASIFKQPVTVVHHMNDPTSTKHDIKSIVPNDKLKQQPPFQLFWERRLQGLGTSDRTGLAQSPLELPRGIRGISHDLSKDTLLRSVATALHVSQGPVVGQLHAKGQQDRHPAVYINPDQPLVQARSIFIQSRNFVSQALIVTEEDIRKQEEQVVMARKQLQIALQELRNIVEQ